MNRSIVPENNKILSSTPLYFTRLNINLEGGKRGGLHPSASRASTIPGTILSRNWKLRRTKMKDGGGHRHLEQRTSWKRVSSADLITE